MSKVFIVIHKTGSYSPESVPLKAFELEEQATAFVDLLATHVRGSLEVKSVELEFRPHVPAPPVVNDDPWKKMRLLAPAPGAVGAGEAKVKVALLAEGGEA